ncbi:MAG: amino acid carrier protein [Proteobacteria bacterium]|nr:amino acid carrier protein [Pseudomonadota bacterium]
MVQQLLQVLSATLADVLFFNVGGFPFIVLWLVVAAIFFTLYLRGVNFRLFGHALHIVSGKYDNTHDTGEVSHLQALLSALSATVGLGSIAGISVGVAIGGPGAIFWMVAAGLLGMATKFAEVTLSMCYRKVDTDGKVYGGPFQYIEAGMRDIGRAGLGRALALLFAVFCLGGALGGGNMFQSNQAVKIMTQSFPALADLGWLLSLGFAVLVGVVLMGSIKRIAKVAEAIVPLKGILYLICAIIVVGANIGHLPSTLMQIITEAFTASAATGGFIGMIAIAFKRASFANEAGLGSAPIAHAAAKTEIPVREAAVALLEPFFAAMIALLTGLMVTITGAYVGATAEDGVLIAGKAFESVAPWFAVMLAINVFIFAYSTTIGWSYYGEIAWCFLFGRRGLPLYYGMFCTATFLGGILNFGVVLDLSDLFILGMSLPNIIVLYALRGRIRTEMQGYMRSIR